MEASVWFGFGFMGFGSLRERQNLEVRQPQPLSLYPGGCEPSRSRISKLRPGWSYTAALTGDGFLVLSGFVGGSPQQSLCLPSGGCQDLLTSEKYLMLLYKDRVECWDTGSLDSGGLRGDPVWNMELSGDEDNVFPLVSTGYVSPKPPFFKELPHQLRAHKLVLGSEHALLLSTQRTVYTWGSGRHGQLGHGGLEDVLEPRTVEALHGIPMGDVAAGGWHSVSVSEAGDIYIWGWNESGQLGLPCKRLAKATERTAGARNSSAEKGEETLMASEDDISVAFISIQAFPALLDLPKKAEAHKASCGSRHTAVVTRSSSLYTWGWGRYGQLGHGDATSSDQPKLVEYFSQHQLYVQDVMCGTWSTNVCCRLKKSEP